MLLLKYIGEYKESKDYANLENAVKVDFRKFERLLTTTIKSNLAVTNLRDSVFHTFFTGLCDTLSACKNLEEYNTALSQMKENNKLFTRWINNLTRGVAKNI
jgi:hypothetical protein